MKDALTKVATIRKELLQLSNAEAWEAEIYVPKAAYEIIKEKMIQSLPEFFKNPEKEVGFIGLVIRPMQKQD